MENLKEFLGEDKGRIGKSIIDNINNCYWSKGLKEFHTPSGNMFKWTQVRSLPTLLTH